MYPGRGVDSDQAGRSGAILKFVQSQGLRSVGEVACQSTASAKHSKGGSLEIGSNGLSWKLTATGCWGFGRPSISENTGRTPPHMSRELSDAILKLAGREGVLQKIAGDLRASGITEQQVREKLSECLHRSESEFRAEKRSSQRRTKERPF